MTRLNLVYTETNRGEEILYPTGGRVLTRLDVRRGTEEGISVGEWSFVKIRVSVLS